MKKYLIIFLFTVFPLYIHPEEKFSRWVYIVHYSDHDKKIINNAFSSYDKFSITGYELSQNGVHENKKSILYLNHLKKSGLSPENFYPLIIFKSRSEGIKILSDRNLIKKTAGIITDFAYKNLFKNIHLDFEYIPAEYSSGLAHLLREIRSKNSGLKITMALFPQIDFPDHLSKFHKPDDIAQFIDEIVLMCYDYKKDSATPSPVTDISWAEKNIIHMLKFFKPGQIYLGVPAYGYSWPEKGKTFAVPAYSAENLIRSGKSYRDDSGCLKIAYTINGINHTAFISDKETIHRLENIVRKYKLKGSALWRLGFIR